MNYVTKTDEGVSYDPFPGARTHVLHSLFTHPFGRSRPVYDAASEGGGGGGNPTPEPKPEPKPDGGTSDEVAKLLRENMAKKGKIGELETRLAEFDGIDAAAVRKLMADAQTAEDKRKADEQAAAEARGEFDRVKTSMGEQHQRELEAERAKAAEKDTALSAANGVINELTVGASFLNSTFIRDNTVLPASVARTTFGDHFEVQDGRPVAYDKPKGAKDRTPLTDTAGKPVGFEEAIKRLVEAHPDKERLLKGKLASGAKSGTTGDTKLPITVDSGALTGASRMAAILASRAKKS